MHSVPKWRNPRNVAAGHAGGKTAVARMTREERKARARKGGVKVFHASEDGDGVRASAYGTTLAWRRWGKPSSRS